MGLTVDNAAPVAHAQIGWQYLVGRDVPQDFVRAVELFQEGCEQGEVAAYGLLGWMYLEGSGVERDILLALQHLQEAYAKGDAAACGVMASMYMDGNGVERDALKAMPLLEEGRRRGLRAASRMLGEMYLHGEHVEKDIGMAVSFLQEAAERGDVSAQVSLDSLALHPTLVQGVPAASLKALRQGTGLAATVAKESLTKRGFCWLIMDDNEVTAAANRAAAVSRDFLCGAGSNTGKTDALTGHVTSRFKDAVRLLTGDYNGKQIGPSNPPTEVGNALQSLARVLDAAQLDIAKNLALMDWCNQVALLNDNGAKYGMLDCVLYRAQQTLTDVVAPHADPGVFVLALPSDPGLELQDESAKWLSPPKGCGVLWAGRAAKGCTPCIHRVAIGNAPRLAMWHELCTKTQLAPPMLEALEKSDRELMYGDTRGTKAVLDLLRKTENHELPRRKNFHIRGISALKLEPAIVPRARLEGTTRSEGISRPEGAARQTLKESFITSLNMIKARQSHSVDKSAPLKMS